ncbi:hypothetical protein [Sinomicrobium sp. M5D2P9]
MKLTNSPESYTSFPVDAESYLIYQRRNFKEGVNELWPVLLHDYFGHFIPIDRNRY